MNNKIKATNSELRERVSLWEELCMWHDQGISCGLATVAMTWGTAPNPIGSHLIFTDKGEFQGSVSGGCIESAVISVGQELLQDAGTRCLQYGVSDETAWSVGLSCGGTIKVLVEAMTKEKVATLKQAISVQKQRASFILEHTPTTLRVIMDSWESWGKETAHLTEVPLCLQVLHRPSVRLVVVGGVAISQTLIPLAHDLGWEVTLVDPRHGWASKQRFPGVTIDHRWPHDYFALFPLDNESALVALCHDPKIDDEALLHACASPGFYIGALGSRKTHAQRLARLSLSEDLDRDRIHAPIGLDIGAQKSAEIAVAIVAEIILSYRKKP